MVKGKKEKKKPVQLVTEEPKSEEAEIILPERPQPQPEPPLTSDERLARLEQAQPIIEQNFVTLQADITALTEAIKQMFQQGQTNPQQGNIGFNPMGLVEAAMKQGGEGEDSTTKKLADMAFDSMKSEIGFSRDFRRLFLSKFAGKELNEMAETVAK